MRMSGGLGKLNGKQGQLPGRVFVNVNPFQPIKEKFQAKALRDVRNADTDFDG